MKKIIIGILIIIQNIFLFFISSYVIILGMLAANLDDFLIPPTDFQRFISIVTGLFVAIIIDVIVNFIFYKIINRKEKNISYKILISISLVITIIDFIILLFQ